MKYLIIFLNLICCISVFSAGALFVPNIDFDDYSYLYISDFLEKQNINYFILSSTEDTIKGKYGTQLLPFMSYKDFDVKKWDFIIIMPGPGIFRYFNDSLLFKIVKDAYENNKLIGSLDYSSNILLLSDIAQGLKLTGKFTEKNVLKYRKIVKLTYYDVLESENIITSYSINYLYWFCQKFKEKYNAMFNTESE